MNAQQPEALDLADWLEAVGGGPSAKRCAALLREQHARIAELEAQLEAIGAGGVSGPMMGQPQEMPDLSALTERGAKAWAGVDAQGLREGFTAADMATASAQGFRDGAAYVAANAGSEPVAIRPDIQAVLAMLDVPVIARMSSHEGKLLKPGQEPPAFESAVPLVREWDHRRACESIIAALSRNK